MSLNWSVKAVKNADDICYFTATKTRIYDGVTRGEEYTHPITDSLVWATMSLGLNEITAENVDEWEKRLALAYEVAWISKSVVFGGYEEDGNIKWEPRMITRADLVNHIGLETNASYESPSAWRKRVMTRMEEEGLRHLKYAEKHNPELDAITWKESLELRDAIRSGKITKEQAALPENQPVG
jgi:hypothetical protein